MILQVQTTIQHCSYHRRCPLSVFPGSGATKRIGDVTVSKSIPNDYDATSDDFSNEKSWWITFNSVRDNVDSVATDNSLIGISTGSVKGGAAVSTRCVT